MKTRDEVEQQVKSLLAQRVGISATHMDVDVRLVDDLEMDSLDSVEVALELERQLHLAVDDRLTHLRTVGELVDLVCDLLATASHRREPRPRS